MDNTNIVALLMEIKGSVGELKESARNGERDREEIKKLLSDHVAVDLAVAKRVSTLEHARSRATGYVLALSAVGGIVVTGGVAIAKAIL